MRISAKSAALALGLLVSAAWPAFAEKVTVKDVTGRDVEVNVPVSHVILGEGRQIYFLAALDKENPFQHVVGWRDDLAKADPETYAAYLAKYPEVAKLPTFGGMKDGTFDIEQAVSLKPDVILMNIDAKTATEEAGYIEKLAKVGIPLVYVDFREKPMENTEPSMRLMGQLTGKEKIAEDFIKFRADSIAKVTDTLEKANPKKPVVFMERAGGYSDDCCMSFGNENFGKMVELAGGINMAKDIIPGTFGNVNPEQIIASNPEQVIITGGNWNGYVPGGNWVGVGYGADLKEAHRKLENLTKRPAFTGVQAVKDGNVHAIWHQFYNNPYQFVAIQEIAKWLHPDLFKDLDPEATFKELHARFLPLDYKPGYFVSLKDAK
ncbi:MULTISPECIES: ABC transporter substrate-binding protein [Agrobacterium]|jgi:iron complex transport system substrate-binding protein|uniref:ABC transporter substrate-binding protein n=3 Tax=Agrobacterium tumefaciens TaxID=358 RepID=A0AAP5DE85_AGRTU|nr:MULTISPECIES: ABC transporter substrate-binding protein [Agrobacterium]MCP2137245.1 iron complex transport system substrate-binding protein [Rhizobium sp. SLBN-94]AYM07512.1 iron complex transport system substrate-binding protein [Agrobacterium tumefaciens]AYM83213.1 iron complex transport system substrate-binding protein [Agrobacterium tumefaciens]EHH04922.1 iron ABC transporter substrate binding protein [Agrobacterium tumefaciens CCNWGS0286]KAA1234091.1 ABC transporter substrate-binding p